jgi:hypothetical protein
MSYRPVNPALFAAMRDDMASMKTVENLRFRVLLYTMGGQHDPADIAEALSQAEQQTGLRAT